MEQKTKNAWIGFAAVAGLIIFLFMLMPSPEYGNTPEQAATGCARARVQSMDGTGIQHTTPPVKRADGTYVLDVVSGSKPYECTVMVKDAEKAFCNTVCN